MPPIGRPFLFALGRLRAYVAEQDKSATPKNVETDPELHRLLAEGKHDEALIYMLTMRQDQVAETIKEDWPRIAAGRGWDNLVEYLIDRLGVMPEPIDPVNDPTWQAVEDHRRAKIKEIVVHWRELGLT